MGAARLNCQAPDAGNGEILHLFGTEEQKERFLKPLVDGTARSFFSMTEPEVSGADPTAAHDGRARRRRVGDRRHKWFSPIVAEGASFGIVMAVTDPDAAPHRRMSQILVPADTPGFEIVRPVPVLGHAGRGWSTHCEVRYTDVRVLRERARRAGRRLPDAQKRLGPAGSTTSCAGSTDAAHSSRCAGVEREAFGGPLADKQTVQNWIADSAAEIWACRLLTLDAARKLDEGGEARVEVSLIKFYAARVLHDVIDRAIQVHGARGLTDETPLGTMYAMARGARIYDGPDEVQLDGRQPPHPQGRRRRHLHVLVTLSLRERSGTVPGLSRYASAVSIACASQPA